MTLRARIRSIGIAVTAAVTIVSYALARRAEIDPVKVALLVMVPLLFVLMGLQILFVRAAQRRLQRALGVDNAPGIRRELSDLIDYFRGQPRIRESLRMAEASLVMSEERYAETRALLEAIDQTAVGEEQLPAIQNGLAFCMAHLGEAKAGIELARAALARAEGREPALVTALLGTLGICYVQAGQPAEAVEILQKALGRGNGQARAQACRAYYLGVALAQLGRGDEAKQAFERTQREAPGSPFAQRAEEQLATLASEGKEPAP